MSRPQFVAGIDFGTTNSVAAISDGETARVVPVEQDYTTMPTALFFDNIEHCVYMGRAAEQKYRDDFSDGRFMRSLKRILGTAAMRTGTQIGPRMVKYEEIIAYFIKYLKRKIDSQAGTDVLDVVMGRPVHFCDNNSAGDDLAQQQLESIARKSGFKNILFQYEPIAAAFTHERLLSREALAMVVDIGGGTSDFSLIRLGPGHIKKLDRTDDVLSNSGVRIGGNDFDHDLSIGAFMPRFGLGTEYHSGDKILPVPNAPYIDLSTWVFVNRVYTPQTLNLMRGVQIGACEPEKLDALLEIISKRLGHTNLDYVERAKIMLSSSASVNMVLDFLQSSPTISLDTKGFDSYIEQNVLRIIDAMSKCLNGACVNAKDIDLVIMTGGSTEIPYISNAVHSMFTSADFSASDKLSSVGLGLAHDAMRRFFV